MVFQKNYPLKWSERKDFAASSSSTFIGIANVPPNEMQRFFESEKRILSGTVPLADGKKKYFDPIWNPSWFALSKYCEDASPIKDRKNANIVAFYESVKFFGCRLSPIVTSIDPTLLHCVLKIYFLSEISHFLQNY